VNWPGPDNSPELGDGRFASAAYRPGSIDELGEQVRGLSAEGLALYPQGGRTALDYGEPPGRPGAAIDLRDLTRVVDYPAADMTITVEAGLTLAALSEILARENQRLPLDVPRPEAATLGGAFATAFAGPRRFGAGRPRDLILGVGFVNARGELIRGGGRVVKNVAGYDFPRLLTGSLGTLGILAELTLKVRPRPEADAIAWVPLDGLDQADAVRGRLNTSATRPVAVELLNRPAAELVGASAALPTSDWVLAVGFEGNAEAVRWQLRALGEELAPARPEEVAGVASGAIWRALADFADRPSTVALVAGTQPSRLAAMLRHLDPGLWGVQCHAGNGIIRAVALDAEPTRERIGGTIEALRGDLGNSGGHLTLARCPTDWKPSLGVWGPPRGDWHVMERLKRALDPDDVMNPGRFVGRI
jgi:glycolate oxidase FAD binding subunit